MDADKVLALAREAGLMPYIKQHEQYDERLSAFAALLQQQMIKDGWRSPEWISVKVGLPLVGVSVLVYEPRRHIEKTCHDGRDWILPHKSNVTHWMPLPNPPSKERK